MKVLSRHTMCLNGEVSSCHGSPDPACLQAEAQSAATAVDGTGFVVCFWHMIFIPLDALKDTLQVKDPMLSPTFITDAKALYDSYHRDAINHGAIDKCTNLELRVVHGEVEGMNGVLKWISSERQFGDGLTKIAARQLLCDPLRHGAIKFTFAERKEPE